MLKHAVVAFLCLVLLLCPPGALSAFCTEPPAGTGIEASPQGQGSSEAVAKALEQAKQALLQSTEALQQAEQKAFASQQEEASAMTEQERSVLLLSDNGYLTALGEYNAARSDYDEAMAAWQRFSDGEATSTFEPQEPEQSRGKALPFAILSLWLIPGFILVRRRVRRH